MWRSTKNKTIIALEALTGPTWHGGGNFGSSWKEYDPYWLRGRLEAHEKNIWSFDLRGNGDPKTNDLLCLSWHQVFTMHLYIVKKNTPGRLMLRDLMFIHCLELQIYLGSSLSLNLSGLTEWVYSNQYRHIHVQIPRAALPTHFLQCFQI